MKTPQRYHFYQFLVMVVIAVLIAAESIYMLYRTSLDEHQRRLSEMAQTHARLIEAVAEFDLEYSGDFPEGSTAATLSQIQQAHRNLSGFGQTGQFLIGLRKQGTIHAVIPLTPADLPRPGVFPAGAPLTRFMDEALNGRSGIGEAVDFRNVPVLAAYEPVKTLGLGLIAKMDVAEIRGPYLEAMADTSVTAVVILGVGSLGFFLIGTPMLRRWEGELRHFADIIEQRSAQLRQSNQDRDREKTYRRQVESSLREKEDKLEQIQEELRATGHRLEETRLELWSSVNSLEKLKTFSRIETADIGLDGRIQVVTPRLAERLECRPEDVQGKSLVELVHPDETSRLKERLQGMREDASSTFNMELHLKKRSGDWLAVSVHSSPVASPDSTPDHFLLLVMEVADRETVQREIAHARHLAQSANHSKNFFVSAMSHEIRTPLNAILGYAQIMLRDSHLDSDQRKKLLAIQRAGNQLLNLVNEVLDFSRIESGNMKHTPVDFDLVRQVKDLAGLFHIEAVKKGLTWAVENRLESAKVLVRGDQGKLRQVLISLLENAVKLTDRGEIRFRVFTPEPDRYRFEVIDTGPGLHPEERERIFESFQWTQEGEKKGGLGLGLAVADRMVALMGGRLEVESEPGQGARFHFTVDLPPARRDVVDKLEPYQAVVALAPGQEVRAVIVDDTPADADMFAEMLRRLGVRVEVALEGLDGVNRILESKPDIVFMDYKMPDIDGLEAFRMVRDQLGTDMVKTVIISASALDTPAEHFLSEGVHGFVQKPLVREEILEVMHRLLGVQYVYDRVHEQTEEEDNLEELEDIDLTALRVPTPLLNDLKQNARLGMFLSMDSKLDALRDLEPHGPALVQQLRHHIDRFDKKKIIDILDALTPA